MNKTTQLTIVFSTITALTIGTFALTTSFKNHSSTNTNEESNDNYTINDSFSKDIKMKKVGDSITINATIEPANSTNKELKWSLTEGYQPNLSMEVSEDTLSVSITKLANYSGYYTLTATSLDNEEITASCKIYSYNDIEEISFVSFSYQGDNVEAKNLNPNYTYQMIFDLQTTSENNRDLDIKWEDFTFDLSDNLKNILTIGNAMEDLGGTPILTIGKSHEKQTLTLANIRYNKENFEALNTRYLTGQIIINDIPISITIENYIEVTTIKLNMTVGTI